jgi:hypothetical protein
MKMKGLESSFYNMVKNGTFSAAQKGPLLIQFVQFSRSCNLLVRYQGDSILLKLLLPLQRFSSPQYNLILKFDLLWHYWMTSHLSQVCVFFLVKISLLAVTYIFYANIEKNPVKGWIKQGEEGNESYKIKLWVYSKF